MQYFKQSLLASFHKSNEIDYENSKILLAKNSKILLATTILDKREVLSKMVDIL